MFLVFHFRVREIQQFVSEPFATSVLPSIYCVCNEGRGIWF